ncbi:hypothetical protein NQ318_005108, partial [Aromia moschata]
YGLEKHNGVTSFSENVLIAYFQELAEKIKSSILWRHYSIIKTVNRKDIGIGKKSKTFSPEEIRTFIDERPDNQFLPQGSSPRFVS